MLLFIVKICFVFKSTRKKNLKDSFRFSLQMCRYENKDRKHTKPIVLHIKYLKRKVLYRYRNIVPLKFRHLLSLERTKSHTRGVKMSWSKRFLTLTALVAIIMVGSRFGVFCESNCCSSSSRSATPGSYTRCCVIGLYGGTASGSGTVFCLRVLNRKIELFGVLTKNEHFILDFHFPSKKLFLRERELVDSPVMHYCVFVVLENVHNFCSNPFP